MKPTKKVAKEEKVVKEDKENKEIKMLQEIVIGMGARLTVIESLCKKVKQRLGL